MGTSSSNCPPNLLIKELEDKYITAYFHKNGDGGNSSPQLPLELVKELEDKYTTAYSHKKGDDKMKEFEKNFSLVQFENNLKNSEGKNSA
ncbi:hypothetical protein COLO4_32434 [Corchorus olitorius]|uniref:Uncharacterized protein n=1 Tax=Corchorus olitorius TaxID=93759 RepID=A0A1R3GZM4_9ROSI|nr:hypothetical protein COLO4_32434 [Corchorus olitorius]